jgi:hypothetical protein
VEVEKEFGDQVVFVGVPGLSNDADAKAQFINATGTNSFANVADGSELWDRFGVSTQRTYVYLDDDGTWRTSGYGSLREDVQALIAS